jgi:hypothetical protein
VIAEFEYGFGASVRSRARMGASTEAALHPTSEDSMSIRRMLVALAAMAVVAPAALRAQDDDIDFATARKQFVAGQPRIAANTLLQSSLGVRQQLGRCRDDAIGAQLIEAESQLEKLATALRSGQVNGVKALDKTLKHIDHVMALHHLTMATAAIAHPRADNIPAAARDLDRAAFHFERSLVIDGTKLTTEQVALLGDVRKLITNIEASQKFPGDAGAVTKLFEAQLASTTVAAK